MPTSKRIVAPNPSSNDTDQFISSKEQPFVPFLNHVTEGCSVQDVDPQSCIPLFLARERSDNAVFKLKSIINGRDGTDNGSGTTLTGFVSGSPSSVVVPLIGDLDYLVDEYLDSLGLSNDEAVHLKAQHEVWYGVVDGCQLHCALIDSIKAMPRKWTSFRWKVFVLRHGLPLEEYRKLAIVQNERCKQENHFEPTLFELLRGLRRVYDNLYAKQLKLSRCGSRGVNIKHRDVAFNYDGGNHDRNTTVKQTVSIAVRLSSRTIEAIGSIVNKPCADIILNCSELNTKKLTSKQAVLCTYDCRLFKNFLCSSTIRGAPIFCNAVRDGDEDAQINTVYRARHWSECNDYKSLKPATLVEQFTLAKQALEEEQKFLSFIGDESWPSDMITTRDNLLRSTVCDDDLRLNKGNETDVLSCLWDCFKRQFPARAKGIVEAGADTPPPPVPPNETLDVVTSDRSSQMCQADTTEEEQNKKEAERLAREESKRLEAARRAALRKEADTYLVDSGIKTFQMSQSAFIRDVWKSENERFDLMLSAVPKECESSTLEKLPSLCKTMLKTGCYIALIVSEDQVTFLRNLFMSETFKVCDHSYKILYDPKTLKRRKNVDFPQCRDDICFVAKTMGTHPSGFIPDFATSQRDECFNSSSSYSSAINIASCVNKLKVPKSNSPIFPEERSVDVFIHLIRMFSPPNGSIVDPFAGPLSVSLACLKTSRTCISINADGQGGRYAVGRLRIFATPEATMERLDDYADDSVDMSDDIVVTPSISRSDSTEDTTPTSDTPAIVSAGEMHLNNSGERSNEEERDGDAEKNRTNEGTNGAVIIPVESSNQSTEAPNPPKSPVLHTTLNSTQPQKKRRVAFVPCDISYEFDSSQDEPRQETEPPSNSNVCDKDAEAANTLASIRKANN